ncbi:MAG TPA: hypothetical protein VFX31_01280 [Ktedonobacterales bacterium]|nr:hypothetical protein [Ktedonobacterales bacterium]
MLSGSQAAEARCVALTQARRGHGISVTGYYLGRALVERGLRVLLVDLTGRHERLHALLEREPVKNLGLWIPPSLRSDALPDLLARARRETAGKVDVLLLDVDASVFQSIGGLSAGIDYVTLFVEAGDTGLRDADHLGIQFDDRLPPYGHVGVALCRTDAERADDAPQRTPEHGLPILGGFPADYLLAASDDFGARGGEAKSPHEGYLIAIRQLARALVEIVPLRRAPSPASSPAGPAPSPTGHSA